MRVLDDDVDVVDDGKFGRLFSSLIIMCKCVYFLHDA